MVNINDDISFAHKYRKRAKQELITFFAKMNYSHVLTLAWNRGAPAAGSSSRATSIAHAKRDIGLLLARLDRRLLGTKFNLKPELRTPAVFFFEKVGTNLHAHGLLRVPSKRLLSLHRMFPGVRGGVWSELVPSGSYKLEIIHDVRTTVGYLLKEQHLDQEGDTVVWADEFFG